MLTLEKFEEASEIVKQVTQETKLIYSKYFSEQTGNKVYLKPENMQFTGAYKQYPFSRRARKRTDYRIGRKSCPGSRICGSGVWGKSGNRNADHYASD